jgi:GNAT superfamily N-acetyltransferase
MPPVISPIGIDQLHHYASIPMLCPVQTRLRLTGIQTPIKNPPLIPIPIHTPYVKNYDAFPQGGPLNWPTHFATSSWGFFLARQDQTPIAGIAIARNTPASGGGLIMLENRTDLAVLWDLRVHPNHQHQGLATALFQTAVQWARSKACRKLKIETQDTNIPACRFYAKMGCTLSKIDPQAYADHPQVAHETMLIWSLDL